MSSRNPYLLDPNANPNLQGGNPFMIPAPDSGSIMPPAFLSRAQNDIPQYGVQSPSSYLRNGTSNSARIQNTGTILSAGWNDTSGSNNCSCAGSSDPSGGSQLPTIANRMSNNGGNNTPQSITSLLNRPQITQYNGDPYSAMGGGPCYYFNWIADGPKGDVLSDRGNGGESGHWERVTIPCGDSGFDPFGGKFWGSGWGGNGNFDTDPNPHNPYLGHDPIAYRDKTRTVINNPFWDEYFKNNSDIRNTGNWLIYEFNNLVDLYNYMVDHPIYLKDISDLLDGFKEALDEFDNTNSRDPWGPTWLQLLFSFGNLALIVGYIKKFRNPNSPINQAIQNALKKAKEFWQKYSDFIDAHKSQFKQDLYKRMRDDLDNWYYKLF